MKMKKARKISGFSIVMLGTALLFYLFFAAYDGAVICVDSPTYIHMESSREPLYPLLLAFFRRILNNSDAALTAVVILQSILAAVSAFSLADYIRREWKVSKAAACLILALPMAVSLLCRFGAKRASMYSNSIMTEGIAIPLYLLFFRFLLEYAEKESKKSLIWCVLLTVLLISTRKQMYLALAMLILVLIGAAIAKGRTKKGIIKAVALTLVILSAAFLFDVGYNYAVRGKATTHSSDIRFVCTVAFYTAEREDGEAIEEETIRELFYSIYDRCEEQGFLGHSAGAGWADRTAHFGDNYDRIQIDTMWPAVNRFAWEESGYEGDSISKEADRVMREISKAVIPHNMGKVLRVFCDNFRSGLVTTVARRNFLLNWYSFILYGLYVALLYLNIKKRKDRRVIVFSSLVLCSVAGNVTLVSLVIFCQTRYTIYNMSLFYSGLLLMAAALWDRAGVQKKEKQNG